MELKVRVVGEDLPAATFHDGTRLHERIRVGLQRGEEMVSVVPVGEGGASAIFEPTFRVARLPDGSANFLGPYAKGTKDERFFYLVWAGADERGTVTSFRRAKIHLSQLPWDRVEAAALSGAPLTVTLSLTDKRGGPRCGSVRDAQWS